MKLQPQSHSYKGKAKESTRNQRDHIEQYKLLDDEYLTFILEILNNYYADHQE